MTYYGGKQRLAKRILELLPPHRIYCEPFAGGAAVLFARDKPDRVTEVLNDYDDRIVNVYRCLQYDVSAERLRRMLENTPFSSAEHKRANACLSSPDPVERAWAVMVSTGMGMMAQLGGSGWNRSKNARGPTSFRNRVAWFDWWVARLEDVQIESMDAIACIERWDAADAVFYCDPPYPGSDQSHYSGYTVEDLQVLVDAIESAKGSFVLSNYDQPEIKLPNNWRRIEIPHSTLYMRKGKIENSERTEVLWIIDRT